RSFSSGKLALPHGTVSLFTGRARPPPSQMPERSGSLAPGGGAWACATNRAGAAATPRAQAHIATTTSRRDVLELMAHSILARRFTVIAGKAERDELARSDRPR